MHRKTFDTPPRRVALFVTCMVDMIYPNVGMATVELLEQQGIEVIFPEEQTCCGQPAFNAGFWDEARVLARRFLHIFGPLVERGEVDAIVAPSGSCVTMTSHFYQALFEEAGNETELRQAQLLSEATFELTEFLVDVLGVSDVGAHYPGKVTYHACCHLLRELQISQQPQQLLDHVAEATLVPLKGGDECCGFGGLFAIKNAPISTAMGERKTRNLRDSDAHLVALCDVSCMTHIQGLLSRQGQSIRTVHIAELLTNRVPDPPVPAEEEMAGPVFDRRWQDARQETEAPAEGSVQPTTTSSVGESPVLSSRDRRWQDIRPPETPSPDPPPQRADQPKAGRKSTNPADEEVANDDGKPRRWQDIG